MKGAQNPNWKGGTTSLALGIRHSFKYRQWRSDVFTRDDFTCQKCKIQDKSGKILEIHHINPLYSKGKDELTNLITLCLDCHHFAPYKLDDFVEYMKEEMTGTATILMKSIDKVRKEHPELFEKFET